MAVMTNGVKPTSQRVVRVGIIGCGEIAQVAHIPTLGFLSSRFQITYLCDVSQQAIAHCAGRVIGPTPKTTTDPEELCKSAEVDLVIIANVDEYHAAHAILALKYDKYVFVEKPMALNSRDADKIAAAEKMSKGKVMVGYMRRYASAFIDAVAEIGDLKDIVYARVRDIIGPNSVFVNQSGTFPQRFSDYTQKTTDELREKNKDVMTAALVEECGVQITPSTNRIWRMLGGLGSHDLSAMREALGMPQKVVGSSFGPTFWSVLFQYDGFPVVYESGLDDIPRFDAHLEIYGKSKSVRVQWDSPYVKGLPTTMIITENKNGEYHERLVRKTYEDAYTLEMKELYEFVANSAPIKTTVEDAKKDFEIFRMIVKSL